MVEKNLTLLFLILFSVSCSCQTERDSINKNEFNIELLGSNLLYSFHYERLIKSKNKFDFKLSAGLHFNPFRIETLFDYRTVGINVEPKILLNSNRSAYVFGIGYTYTYLFDNLQENIFGCCGDLSLLMPRLGYRRYTKSEQRYFGISFNPIFVLDLNEEGDEFDNNFIIPYGGLQYGWKF